ncbi:MULTISPECIES: plasmid mobilization relaxosome protein MobC [Actinomycetes]|uniref:plasmid mobilization relaxosome protein MobC n=1 Tax=Actinomycetes TaxID=1760 RepID=UPI00242F6366|nr:plasmid mobilization relaxosome protein MobC [Dermabacter hominis]MDU5545745.1 plasmid mobilization relaxosome protein MobC [Cutibacterium avidum]MDU5969386.1 plasmid mobilization relaxosome protein MobC [Cutibacterium avidum]
MAVLAGAPVPQPPNVDLLAVRREVNALGVNVNQIARRVNNGERVAAVELQQMVDMLHELVRRWSS